MTTTSISSSPEIRAKSVVPTFVWSVATTTRCARSITAALTAASLMLPTLRPSSEKPLTPRKATPKANALGSRAPACHERPLDGLELAAEQHAVDAGDVAQRGDHRERVGERRQARARPAGCARRARGRPRRRWSRCRGTPSRRRARARDRRGRWPLAGPVGRLPAANSARRPAQRERPAVGRLRPAGLQRAEVLRIVGSVTPSSLASSPMRPAASRPAPRCGPALVREHSDSPLIELVGRMLRSTRHGGPASASSPAAATRRE